MLRILITVIAAVCCLATACPESPGTAGSGTTTKQPGVKPGQNGGIAFGGWHMPGGDHTRLRRCAVNGPSQPDLLWSYRYLDALPDIDSAHSMVFCSEPLVDLDGNVYIHVKWVPSATSSITGDLFDPAGQLAMLKDTYASLRQRNSFVMCIAPEGSLKWMNEFTGSDLAGIAISPSGYLVLNIGGAYIEDKELDRYINKLAADPNNADRQMENMFDDEVFSKVQNISGIHVVDSDGRVVQTIEPGGHNYVDMLVTSNNLIVTPAQQYMDWSTIKPDAYNMPDGYLTALDLGGNEIWRNDDIPYAFGLAELPNGTIIMQAVTQTDEGSPAESKLLAVDAGGNQLWDFKLPEGSNYSYMVDAARQRIVLFRQHQESPAKNMRYTIAFDGKPLDKIALTQPFFDTPLLLGDGSMVSTENKSYYFDSRGNYAADVPDKLSRYTDQGATTWSRTFETSGRMMAFVSDAADSIYFSHGESALLDQGCTFGVQAIDSQGTVRWDFRIDEEGYLFDLAIGPDGTLYCATDTTVYAIGPGSPANRNTKDGL